MRRTLDIHVAATRDLEECARYIRKGSRRSATRFLRAAKSTCRTLLRFPMMGGMLDSTRPELEGLRVFPVKGFASYLLFYRLIESGIELVRVLHGARDIPSILEQQTD